MIPALSLPRASSASLHSMPRLASPRISACRMVIPPGSVAPTGAKGYSPPSSMTGAPHTTWAGASPPASTSHSESRSAFGWGLEDRTRPTTTSSSPAPGRAVSSTGAPSMPSRSASSSGGAWMPGAISRSQR